MFVMQYNSFIIMYLSSSTLGTTEPSPPMASFKVVFSCKTQMSSVMRKSTIWFPNRSDINRAVQAKKIDRGWKFWIEKVDELYYLCSENKDADQLRSYCQADLAYATQIEN